MDHSPERGTEFAPQWHQPLGAPLYPILPVKAPILGRSTDDWMPVDAREVAGAEMIVVSVEKIDNPGWTGTLTVDTGSKIVRHLDRGWIEIEVVDWSPLIPGQEVFAGPFA
ncbi:hypothetical protein ACWEOE_12835 [Amycolatopsis sp. NPDC004368]